MHACGAEVGRNAWNEPCSSGTSSFQHNWQATVHALAGDALSSPRTLSSLLAVGVVRAKHSLVLDSSLYVLITLAVPEWKWESFGKSHSLS